MKQTIVGLRRDNEGDWVADLGCDHTQHVRHRPPWQICPWVTTDERRRIHHGRQLDCKKCDADEAAGRTTS
jgi:hypothetical protein